MIRDWTNTNQVLTLELVGAFCYLLQVSTKWDDVLPIHKHIFSDESKISTAFEATALTSLVYMKPPGMIYGGWEFYIERMWNSMENCELPPTRDDGFLIRYIEQIWTIMVNWGLKMVYIRV